MDSMKNFSVLILLSAISCSSPPPTIIKKEIIDYGKEFYVTVEYRNGEVIRMKVDQIQFNRRSVGEPFYLRKP